MALRCEAEIILLCVCSHELRNVYDFPSSSLQAE
jgi:hypothetical protein